MYMEIAIPPKWTVGTPYSVEVSHYIQVHTYIIKLSVSVMYLDTSLDSGAAFSRTCAAIAFPSLSSALT